MNTKSLTLAALLLLTAITLAAQSANYYAATPPDCSSLGSAPPVAITNTAGATIGYSCYVSGTFVWFASGGGWSTSIRLAAPATSAILVDYSYYDKNGSPLSLDTAPAGSSALTSGVESSFVLAANQPSQLDLLGATGTDQRSVSANGSVYAVVYCPDAATCANAVPQMLYSALPAYPWALSVPIVWDSSLSAHWSAEGIGDASTHSASLVVYNAETTATTYTVRVYDNTGKLASSTTTAPVAPLQALGGGYYGEGGTAAITLTSLPTGVFKISVDGGTARCAVEALQFTAASSSTLLVMHDPTPTVAGATATAAQTATRRMRHVVAPIPAPAELQ